MSKAEEMTRELLAKHLGVLPADVSMEFVRFVVALARQLARAGLLEEEATDADASGT